MTKYLVLLVIVFFSRGCAAIPAGNPSSDSENPFTRADSGLFRLLFYNVENLFDILNDPRKDDDAFTPGGDRRWNSYRLKHKVNNIYKAIAAASEFSVPAVIGLCEVENIYVLEMLARQTGLKNHDYNIIHRESADRRGIDVALLYRPVDFKVLDTIFKQIDFPFDGSATTRDILYIKGIAGISDTLHLYVNHWPSRWGGQGATERYRNHAAWVLRSLTDSVFKEDPLAKIIIMGDFNDEPENSSLKDHLGAKLHPEEPQAEGYSIYHIWPAEGMKGAVSSRVLHLCHFR
jgi:endonuclease/exonuclease/phosphatase family metal-dependent hydrolase